MAISRVLVLLLMVIVTVHAGKHTDPRKVKPIPPKSDIIGDGNCLYRAVAQYLYDSQENHRNVRQDILNLMTENEDVYRRFIVHDHNGDYESFISQHRRDGEWAEDAMVQAAADLYGINIIVNSNGNSGALQVVRARSHQGVESWLHLAHSASHYNIISDSSQEGAVEPQNAVDLHDIYSLNTPEHDKIIPDDEVTKINNPFLPKDAVDNICYGLQDVSFSEKKEDFQDIRGKKEIRKTLLELENKQTDEKIAERERVENLGRLDNQYVELDVEEEETHGEKTEPTQINEVLSSSEEEKTNTEVPSDEKAADSLLIKDLNHLRSLIENGEVQFGSHFRVTRRRWFFEYHHHYFIKEANDKSLTVVHVKKTHIFHIQCKEDNIGFSGRDSNLLDFASGVELLYKYENPTNESALEAINLRMQHMLSLDFVNYSLTSRIHNKINCASLVSYIKTGEKDHSDVHDFIHRYGIFAILLILSVEFICSCFLIYQVKFPKNVFSKLKGKLINRFGIAKLQITDWMYSLFGIVNNCIFHPVVKLWIILMKNVFKRKRDGN